MVMFCLLFFFWVWSRLWSVDCSWPIAENEQHSGFRKRWETKTEGEEWDFSKTLYIQLSCKYLGWSIFWVYKSVRYVSWSGHHVVRCNMPCEHGNNKKRCMPFTVVHYMNFSVHLVNFRHKIIISPLLCDVSSYIPLSCYSCHTGCRELHSINAAWYLPQCTRDSRLQQLMIFTWLYPWSPCL